MLFDVNEIIENKPNAPLIRVGSSSCKLKSIPSFSVCLSVLLLEDPEAFLIQLEHIIQPESSGLPLSQTCPEFLCREASGGHPNQMPLPLQQAPFNTKEQLVQERVRGLDMVSENPSSPAYPCKENYFQLRLAAVSAFLS